MSKRDMMRAVKIVGGTMALFVGVVALIAWFAWSYPRRPHRAGDGKKVKVVVSRGMTASGIGHALAERDLVDHPSWFRFYATERGDAQKVKPGQYTFSPSMTPAEILDALVAGVPEEEVAVTLPEGKNILEVAALLEEAGVCPAKELLESARDGALMRQLGVPGETFEGYLYPDRYQFRPATPAPKVIARLVKHGKEVYAELRDQHKAGIAALHKSHGFDDHQIVLMASLVEKETAVPAERPRIAGVFLNRLKLPTFKPHLLQTDPTIAYGCTVPLEKSAACEKFEGRIRKIQLEDKDNRYSTYAHEGLPPGPICNPGRAALEAVMEPDIATPFLYFVSKNDGTHYFSKTRAEHEAAVDKYQRHGGG
jgi:UPF0755 protein